MKDIENLLKSSAKPQRPLSADFTNKIVNHIADHPKLTWREQFMENFMEKVLTKPAIAVAAFVFTVLAAGTSYATVAGWPAINAFFNGETPTSDGRIVEVKADNCYFQNAFNVVTGDKTNDTFFYKVKNDSKLTNEDVVKIVKGNCQLEAQIQVDGKAIDEALARNPLNKDKVVGGAFSEVVAVSENSITLKSEMGTTIDGKDEVKVFEQTFNNIAPDVFVYDSPHQIGMQGLKVGDKVTYKYRASGKALTHSESTPPWDVNPDEQVIVVIQKTPDAMAEGMKFQRYNGREFEQVIPCDHTANGFCTVSEYYQHKQ
ncbi:MAG TPA: hypothetical protein VLA77_04465 [Candidatus Saccharimonadales bacterium]|nr:hypothetical protein [Candidatus Saccharimonadales bacterium]